MQTTNVWIPSWEGGVWDRLGLNVNEADNVQNR